MKIEELIASVKNSVEAKKVYAEPYEKNGVTVIADSAQFSAAVSELSPPGTAGSALSLQTAVGFVFTAVTIVLVGVIAPADGGGWGLAFGLLALGPVVGSLSMWLLRRRPEAVRMANGNR